MAVREISYDDLWKQCELYKVKCSRAEAKVTQLEKGVRESELLNAQGIVSHSENNLSHRCF